MSWGSQHLRYFNGTKIPIVATQDFDHAMIHLGKGFTHVSRHNALAAAASFDHLLVTGPHPVHMRVLHVQSEGAPVSFIYYEDTVVSANGTAAGIGNNNRVSSIVSECSMYHGPTVTDVGNELGQDFYPNIGGGGNSGTVGTLAGGEWILKPNTNYLIRFTNEDAQPTDFVVQFFWYEPQAGEN